MTYMGPTPCIKLPLRLLVCGDRNWADDLLIYNTLAPHKNNISVIIQGEARGADTKARLAAEALSIFVLSYPARWAKQGRAAGPLRNRRMLYDGQPNFVLAFHDDIESSKGTRDMLLLAGQVDVPRCLVSHEDPGAFAAMLKGS